MTALWLGIALLSLLAVAFVLLPVYRARQLEADSLPDVNRRELNITIYQERLSELDAELTAGTLDQENYASLKLELERNLLQDVDDTVESSSTIAINVTRQSIITAFVLAMLLPAMGLALYSQYGRSSDLSVALNQPADPFNGKQPTVDEAIAALQDKLTQQPENPEGWYLLANTFMSMQNYTAAAEGYANALTYLPKDAPQYAGVNGQYAQALFFASNGTMNDQIRKEVEKTLTLEPFEVTALGLLGIEAYESGNYRDAMGFWQKGLRNATGEQADSLRSGVRSARDKLIAAGETVPDLPEIVEAKLELTVSLKPELQSLVKPDMTVFVFARPVGGRMPLAAKRLTVADLPVSLVLDDSLSMSPDALLSSADQVEVVARISASGQPRPAAGDLSGMISPVAVHDQVDILELSIDQVVE
ncbi:c-type cytochrome biogenesis protein CcmI [Amphritea japonica]|uniref:Cytochrome c-type biogenesis protein CcmH n=1 Tax=Amphritea japonica ATCC BAA-1530 TaxID=1278309 RepID=A0A7R6P857_9GAMM|nr:c-type cytochrome biogenesis protein CcmI [Amphritea japonica]BBB25207.1 cytochrome c-type biogenesis protein CcmH [Amphritea japonica ATCC BAA-1530]